MRFKLFVAATILCSIASQSHALLFRIDATGAVTPSGGGTVITTSDFYILFDDTSGDGLLQADEITEFSGTTVTTSTNAFVYDTLLGTPFIAGISANSGTGGLWWLAGPAMSGAIQDGWFTNRWTSYSIGQATSTVPEPGSLGLFAVACVVAGLCRRRLLR